MKKVMAIAIAVVLVALSALPAFAATIESPSPTRAYYIIITDDEIDGGKVVADYETEVGEDGKQTGIITGIPDDGYEFERWEIDGDYVPLGDLTDSKLELIISSDIRVKAVFKKVGSVVTTTSPSQDKVVDNGSKSPQTGSGDHTPYVILFGSVVALLAVVAVAKRRSAKK